jgi:hypothetical protein
MEICIQAAKTDASYPAAIGVTRIRPRGHGGPAPLRAVSDPSRARLVWGDLYRRVEPERQGGYHQCATFKANARGSGHAEVPGRGELHR